MRVLEDANVKNKTVLLRVDFNVLIDKGKVIDNSKIKAVLPTIKYLISKKAKILLLSHLGRPKGKRVGKLSLEPVSVELSKLLKKPVKQLRDCVSPFIRSQIENMNSGDVFMLENVRFYKEEEKNNTFFAKKLVALADIYVNDAFGTCHRKHASVSEVPKYLPSYAGLLLQKEVDELNKILNPKQPFVLLLGGAKVSDKLGILENLASKTDKILVGGAMVFPFWQIKKLNIGKSLLDKDGLKFAKKLLDKYSEKIILPVDLVCAEKINETAEIEICKEVPNNSYGLDIGPETVKVYKSYLKTAKTIFWNGPLGLFEIEKFAKGSEEIAKFLSTQKSFIVVGGGETESVVSNFSKNYSHVSTGGGAALDYLSGKELPGIKVLK